MKYTSFEMSYTTVTYCGMENGMLGRWDLLCTSHHLSYIFVNPCYLYVSEGTILYYVSVGTLGNDLENRSKQLSGLIKAAMDNLRSFIDSLNSENKRKFRCLEKLNSKLIETTHSIHFNLNVEGNRVLSSFQKYGTLPRGTRRMIAQLRAQKCLMLKSYLHGIGANATPNCPLCECTEHTCAHLFSCPSVPTELAPIDLWSQPVRAAELINDWDRRSAADEEAQGAAVWL